MVPCICQWIHLTRKVSEWKIVTTMFHKLLVRCIFFFFFLFSSDFKLVAWYYSDHRPRIIDNEKLLHSQIHAVSSGMWALAPPPLNMLNILIPPLGPQNATSPRIAPSKIAESNVHLQTNTLPPPQPISPSHLSGDHTHHLEQLLDSSLATVAVIQF